MHTDKKYLQIIEKDTADSPALDVIYDFTQTYQKYMENKHNYFNNEFLTSIEAHLLKHICQNDGVTLTDIVNYWGRTKGTVSSQIKKLETKGFVYREKCKSNPKKIHIFPTDKGLQANEEHIRYDIEESVSFIEKWLDKYSFEQMETFIDQITFYTEHIKSRIK